MFLIKSPDTPLCDAAAKESYESGDYVQLEVARSIERDLNYALARIDILKEENARLVEENNRLSSGPDF